MGVTIKCKKTGREMDVGYFGFFKLRTKVAELVGSEVGEHYKKLDDIFDMPSPEKENALESYNDETERLVESKELPIKIADFLYQSDCDGKIRYGACKQLIMHPSLCIQCTASAENKRQRRYNEGQKKKSAHTEKSA